MNNEKNIRQISKEFNNQLESTSHFGTFSEKNIYNNNPNFLNKEQNYPQQLYETNPKKSNINYEFINDNESANFSFGNIKFFPNYCSGLEEALKVSNSNVQDLKETIKEKLKEEKKLKSIIDQLKFQNNNLIEINEALKNKIDKYENDIKKYKNANDILRTEITNLEEDIEDNVKILKIQLEKAQEENNKLINLNKSLSDENFKYIEEIKQLKIEIKKHLYEKVKFLKVDNLNKEQKLLNEKLYNIIDENKIQIRALSKENDKLKDLQKDYHYLNNNYKKVCDNNIQYKEKMRNKENIQKNFEELKEKYDKEKFENICKINIWKKNFIEIAKYKLLNYNSNYNQNIINVMKINEKYIKNSPDYIKNFAEKILKYFKELIDQEIKSHKENKNITDKNIIEEFKEKINILNNKLEEEKKVRRKIFNKFMNLRGNIGIMCNFKHSENNEKINKNSQIDTLIVNKNNILVKNNENNNIRKFEFDYIFQENANIQDIYEELYPLIHSLFKGNNVIILSYGEKVEKLDEKNNLGIEGKSIQQFFYIFNNSNKDKYNKYEISMNIFYIVNNEIYNLCDKLTPKINIDENNKEELEILDLSIEIKSYEEFNKLFKLSKKFLSNSKNIIDKNISSQIIYSFNIKLEEKDGKTIENNLIFIYFERGIKLDNIIKENANKGENKKHDENLNQNNEFSDYYLFNFLTQISNNKMHEYKEWNNYILLNYIKSYINEKKYKLLLLIDINPDLKELDENLKVLEICDKIIHKINDEI